MEWYTAMLPVILGLLILLIAGVPVALSLSLVGIFGVLLTKGFGTLSMLGTFTFSTLAHYVISPLPVFILMGEILMVSEISRDSFDAAHKLLSRIPGALSIASIGACAVFAATIGSSPATCATVGLIAIPQMLSHGYNKRLAVGSVGAGGALGILIPPSLLMVVYGVIAEESVGQLFMAGFIPGLILAAMLAVFVMVRCQINPNLAPRSLINVPWRDRLKALWRLFPILSLAISVLGSIYFGIATPTEAGAIGAFGAFCLAIYSRKLTFAGLRTCLINSAATSTFLMFIYLGANIFGYLVSVLGIPQGLSETLLRWDLSRWSVLVATNVLYLILGCLLDPAGVILITGPIIIPVVRSLGFDMVWFGIIVVLNMEMANITPPFGFNLFVIKGILEGDVSMADIIKGCAPFLLIQALALVLVLIFPNLALWLPSMMKAWQQ